MFILILIDFIPKFSAREENAYYRGRIDELNRQLDNANTELRDLRNDVGKLKSYNIVASQEIEELRDEIERLHTVREDPGDNADIESEDESRPIRRKKPKVKSKKPEADRESGSEPDIEGARVRYKYIIKPLFLLTDSLYNLDRNENHT